MRRHVTEINVEAMLPQELPVVRIKCHDTFLLQFALARRVLQIDMVTHDDRRRTSAVWGLPGEILTGRRPLRRQILLEGDPVALGASPLSPIARGCGNEQKQ